MDKDTRIAILGFGIEGKSIAQYLRKEEFTDITVCDQNEEAKIPQDLKQQVGAGYLDDLSQFEVIFRSPGIPVKTKEIQSAAKNGSKVTSVTKFFFEKCPGKIVGITGTKGKGTTSSLLYEMLKRANKNAYLGGNIGNSPIEFLDKTTSDSIVVLELGHGQIEDLEKGPEIGIILGVTEDHLDYHPSLESYRRSKHPLIAFQAQDQKAIINIDYEGNQPFLKLGESKKYHISTREKVSRGAYLDGSKLVLDKGLLKTELMDSREVALLGKHNLENVLPASLAATLLGADKESITETIKTFRGLPHRLELVAETNGIKYINDSFSTTPLTSIAAMKAFGKPVILIAGGSEKHADFTEWAEAAEANSVKKILLIGDTAERMAKSLDEAGYKNHQITETLEAAFNSLNAKPGDIVVMSPACASFGLFENYKKRGERFRKLALDQG